MLQDGTIACASVRMHPEQGLQSFQAMGDGEFTTPPFWSPRVALGRLLLLIACVAFAGWFAVRDRASSSAAIGMDLLSLMVLASVWVPARTLARRVAVRADALVGVTYLGRHTTIDWDDVHVAAEFQLRTVNRLLAFRVVSKAGSEIVFTGLTEDYVRLAESVRSRTADAGTSRGGRWSWWKRLVLG